MLRPQTRTADLLVPLLEKQSLGEKLAGLLSPWQAAHPILLRPKQRVGLSLRRGSEG
jgi:hypothetical protein